MFVVPAFVLLMMGANIAPETCRAYNVVKNNKEYKVHLVGLESNIYVYKNYTTKIT
jgi:hypothetical protein